MRSVLFITHPEVVIDAAVPVPRWPLSAKGIARMMAFARSATVANVTAIHASDETKAQDGARILADSRGLAFHTRHELGENDRSATGFLKPAEFEATADEFFANPTVSIRGWERAIDAQSRIVSCVSALVRADQATGDIAIVAHGGVGTLLLCHLMGVAISRAHDQPGAGGGNYFAFDAADFTLRHGWRSITPVQS